MEKHKHNEWVVLLPNECINLGETIEVKIRCNHYGCNLKRKIKVQIQEVN